MLPLVDQHIPRKAYTREELEKLLEVDLLTVVSDIQRSAEVLEANK